MSSVLNPKTGTPFRGVAGLGGATTRAPLDTMVGCLTSLGAVTVLRPLQRQQGSVFAVFDQDGNADVNGITVDGDGDLIDGRPTLISFARSMPLVLAYDAGQWRRLVPSWAVDGFVLPVQRSSDARPDPRLPVTICSGSVNANGTRAGGVGFTSAKTATGVYVLTLSQGFTDAQGAIVVTPHQTVAAQNVPRTLHLTDLTKQVEIRVGGVLSDAAFDFVIEFY